MFNPEFFYQKTISSLHPKVVDYITLTDETDPVFIKALNRFVLYLKLHEILPKLQMWHIIFGTDVKSSINFIDNALYQLTYFGGGVIDNSGYQHNGVNSYAKTGFIPNLVQDVNSNGMTLVVGSNNVPLTSDTVDIGALGSGNSFMFLKNSNAGNGVGLNTGTLSHFGSSDIRGPWTANRLIDTTIIHNGNIAGKSTAFKGGVLPETEVYYGNLNFAGVPYTDGWSNQLHLQYFYHENLTDSEIALFHAGIDIFEETIGRKTW